MRKPYFDPASSSQSHRHLYEHDMREWHNPNPADHTAIAYRTRVNLILQTISEYCNEGVVLDIGCAQGNLSILLAERGYDVVAVDLRHEYLKYMILKYEQGKLMPVAASLDALPFGQKTFDVVLLGEVIEHVAHPDKVLATLRLLLKDGGHLLITTPNGKFLRSNLPTASQIDDWDALEEKQYQPDADGHLFLFTKGELESLLKREGFRVVTHIFYNTFFLTGSIGFRHLGRWLPRSWLYKTDQILLRSRYDSRLAQGQLVAATPIR